MVHTNVCMQTGPDGTKAGAHTGSGLSEGNLRHQEELLAKTNAPCVNTKIIFFQLFLIFREIHQCQWSKQLLLGLRSLDGPIHYAWTVAPALLNLYQCHQMGTVNTITDLYNPNDSGLNSPAPFSYLTIALRLLWPVYSLFCLVVSALNRNNNHRLNRSQIQPASLEGLRPFILRYSLSRNKNRCFTYRAKKGNELIWAKRIFQNVGLVIGQPSSLGLMTPIYY